jgi:hypothetical protein
VRLRKLGLAPGTVASAAQQRSAGGPGAEGAIPVAWRRVSTIPVGGPIGGTANDDSPQSQLWLWYYAAGSDTWDSDGNESASGKPAEGKSSTAARVVFKARNRPEGPAPQKEVLPSPVGSEALHAAPLCLALWEEGSARVQASFAQGALAFGDGLWRAARKSLANALALEAKDTHAACSRGWRARCANAAGLCCVATSDFQAAVALFEEAEVADPHGATQVWRNIACVRRALGQTAEAEEAEANAVALADEERDNEQHQNPGPESQSTTAGEGSEEGMMWVEDAGGGDPIKMAFLKYDVDGSGELELNEIGALIEHYGLEMTPTEVAGVFEALDEDSSGAIGLAEFRKVHSFPFACTPRIHNLFS